METSDNVSIDAAGYSATQGAPSIHGFWDYTTPGAGGMEGFLREDYLLLLDDMAAAGMNTLAICIKWLTTGYRSRLSYLEQSSDNPVIESDNELLRTVIEQARRRGIDIWLNVVLTMFEIEHYGLNPYRTVATFPNLIFPKPIGFYDLDEPIVRERAIEIVAEIVELFPDVAGLTIEVEESGVETPPRVALYNEWAQVNAQPEFAQLGHPFHPRYFDVAPWRDYTTHRRIELLQQIETHARNQGFTGHLSMLCESGRTSYTAGLEVNTKMFQQRMPTWQVVTYEYDKWDMRHAMMDFAISLPKRDGLKVNYLPRGVMTWAGEWPMPLSLEQSWLYDHEDIARFRPDGVLWFGCGASRPGAHVDVKRLQQAGYESGVAARRALLKTISLTTF